MAKKLIISNVEFNKKKPLIIAEIGNNHQGDISKCEELFYAAKRAGVDAVKLQKKETIKNCLLMRNIMRYIIVKMLFPQHMENIEIS